MNVPDCSGFSTRDFEHSCPTRHSFPPQLRGTQFCERPINVIDRVRQICLIGFSREGREPHTLALASLSDDWTHAGRSCVRTGYAKAVAAVGRPDSMTLQRRAVLNDAIRAAAVESLKTTYGRRRCHQGVANSLAIRRPSAVAKVDLSGSSGRQTPRFTLGPSLKVTVSRLTVRPPTPTSIR